MTDRFSSGSAHLRALLAEADENSDARAIKEAKEEVIGRFQPSFSREAVAQLEEGTMREFVRFANNRHWSGIHRQIGQLVSDMDVLRSALSRLLNEELPLESRFGEALDQVPGLGPAVATAILHVSNPERYGVWNGTSESGLRATGLWPKLPTPSLGEQYAAINEVLCGLNNEAGIDLWTIDMLWWFDAQKRSRQPELSGVLASILAEYRGASAGKFGKTNPAFASISTHFERAVSAIRASAQVKANPALRVSYSVGKGVWARVPWIAIMDKGETTSTQSGVYLVYLFREDMSGVYLALSQGVTIPLKELGRTEGLEALRGKAREIRKVVTSLESRNFGLDGGIVISETAGLGADYEAATAAHRFYDAGALPPEEVLMGDLDAAVTNYLAYLNTPMEEHIAPGRTWIISAGRGGELWDDWRTRSVATIGFGQLGDLREYDDKQGIENAIWELAPEGPRPYNKATACFQFSQVMAPGDRLVVKRGRAELIGWGVVTSDYRYRPGQPHTHERDVDWRVVRRWSLPYLMPMKTLTDWTQYPEAEADLWALLHGEVKKPAAESYKLSDAMSGLFVPEEDVLRWLELLEHKKNLILQGPPGVGKTFIARRLAYLLMGVKDRSRAPMVQFHQSYGYEDFIQGFRPNAEDGGFELVDGTFVDFCREALERPEERFVYLIDEINRANLSKVFGEVMMLIEADKRGEDWAVPLTYSTADAPPFHVPPNVYLLGMMNTADRGLAMVDYALRRRFAFETLRPQFTSPGFRAHLTSRDVPAAVVRRIVERLTALNRAIEEETSDLGAGYLIGHSFFCAPPAGGNFEAWYGRVIRTEVAPLLREYFFDQAARAEALIEALLAG